MSKNPLKLLLVILAVAVGVFVSYFVSAQVSSQPDITFPVAELNNCKSETECKAYCDKPENIDVCVDFAQKHGLMTADEAAKAKQFKDVAQVGGPGGCKGQDQCETYCNDPTHMDECISFAEKYNLMSADDLSEAQKVSQALKQGAKLPGGCKGKQACEAYCKVPTHAGECLDFATKAGFIPSDQVEQARKMVELVKSGDAPQECLAGKDQCQQYCSEESHRDQCVNFMVKAGFMKPEDAEVFKKTGGKGPGGCQSKDECEAFCNAPENQKTCFQFGKDNGLIPEDQLKQIQENSDRTKNAINTAPSEVKQCLQSSIDPSILQEIESGTFLPSQQTGEQIGQQMQKCFEKFMPKNMKESSGSEGQQEPGDQEEGMPAPGNNQSRGPGGCSSVEECVKYCSDPSHASECGNLKGGEQQQENQLPANPVPMMSPPPGSFTPNPSGQPVQSFNPQIPLQSIQVVPPPNTQPYSSGQPYPTAPQVPQSSPGQPLPSPTSSANSFFSSIVRFISGER